MLKKIKLIINELFKSMNIIKFGKKEDFESFLKNDSLVLINSKFLFCLNDEFSEKLIQYNVFNNKINIYLDNNEILSFKSNKNIISLNGIINYSKRNNNKENKFSNMQNLNQDHFYDYNNPYLLKAIKLYFYYQEFSKKIKKQNMMKKNII